MELDLGLVRGRAMKGEKAPEFLSMETNNLTYQVSGGCRGDLIVFVFDRKSSVPHRRLMIGQEPARNDSAFLSSMVQLWGG